MYIASIFAQRALSQVKSEHAAMFTPSAIFHGTLPEFLTEFDATKTEPDLIIIDAKSLFGLTTYDKPLGHYANTLHNAPHIVVDETIIRTGGYYTKTAGINLPIIELYDIDTAKDAQKLLTIFKTFSQTQKAYHDACSRYGGSAQRHMTVHQYEAFKPD